MPSKRFSNELCVYCGQKPSTTSGDHVVARSMVVSRHRGNLPKVPCCKDCNDKKSRLEHYAATVLPFGGQHEDSLELLSGTSAKLHKNKKLAASLHSGMNDFPVISSSGKMDMALGFPIEFDAVRELSVFIALGLLHHIWSERISCSTASYAFLASNEGDDALFRKFFVELSGTVRSGEIGNGTLTYLATKSLDKPLIAIWRLRFLGGLMMTDGSSAGENMWVMQGPKNQIDEFRTLI